MAISWKKIFVLSFILMGILIPALYAQNIMGKVVDVFGKNVTVAVNGQNNFKAGNKIDLSYLADTMEFLIGQYEVTQVKGNVFIAKEISSSMPPSKEMTVRIVPSQNLNSMMKSSGQEAPVTEKPGQKDSLDQMGDLFIGSGKAESSDQKIEGEVIEVMGQDVRVKLLGQGNPQVGYAVDLFFETSTGTRLPVGNWQVKSVSGREVVAEPVDGEGLPRKGLKAVIYKAEAKKKKAAIPTPSASSWVVPVETTNRMASNTYNATSTTLIPLGNAPIPQADDPMNLFPPVYHDFNSFQQAIRNNQRVSIEQKWVLGVQIQNAEGKAWPNNTKFLSGVYVASVTPHTPAQKAGIQPGDIIFHVDNIPVQNVLEFLYLINASDGKVVLNIKRSPDITKAIIKTVPLKKFEASLNVGEAPKLFDQTVVGK